jgi:iron-sulfur cluster repair protein YtfE (RIC family)
MSEFVVRPFAFMRLTHEALRDGFAQLKSAADDGDFDRAASSFTELLDVIDLHKEQEERVFFPMLDELFDGAVANAGLRENHVNEDAIAVRVDVALEARDLATLQQALTEWAPSFEAHLFEEEEVMMPLTERVAPTLEGRAAAVHEILAVDWERLKTIQIPYVVRSLSATKPYGPLRMFVAALQVAAGDEYGGLEDHIRSALPEEKVAMLVEHGHLSRPN